MNLQYMILLYCRNTLKTLSCFWGPLLVDSALGSDLVARLAKTHKNLNVIKGRVRKLIDGDTKDFGKD